LSDAQIGTIEEALKAKEAGVDGIIVQGREAGGHVIGQVSHNPTLFYSFHLVKLLYEIFQEAHTHALRIHTMRYI
jgi:NAD(P)H-dependent flavin oxidoreductase YrpB (nitropropane dioxygenase family)